MRKVAMLAFGLAGIALVWALPALAGSGPAGNECFVGVYTDSDEFFFDENDNAIWDGAATDSRFRIAPALGVATPLVGDFLGNGSQAAGKFDPSSAKFALDLNENDVWDGNAGGDRVAFFVGSITGGVGFLGEWGSLTNDSVGRYVSSEFWLDDNGNGIWDGTPTDARFPFIPSLTSVQIVLGDWDGNGSTDVGKYDPATGIFYGDANGNRVWDGVGGGDVQSPFAAGLAVANGGGVIVVGNWNGMGGDQIALYIAALDLLLVDTNGNFIWDGAGNGDNQFKLAAALMGTNSVNACDFQGDGSEELNKYNFSSSKNATDLNHNYVWDGNAGGDRVAPFIPALSANVLNALIRAKP